MITIYCIKILIFEEFSIKKIIMKNIVRFLGLFIRIIFPFKLIEYYRSFKRNLYTGYYSSYFKSFGNYSVIDSQFHMIGCEYISIGNYVTIGKRCCITVWKTTHTIAPEISIGDNVNVGDDCHITASNKIIIGNNVLFGKKVTVTDNSHGRCDNLDELSLHPSDREVFSKNPVIIKDKVWIGDKVTILPGVTIGKGAIIGANSVVTKDVDDNCIVAGVPAKVVKKL
jgi:acetyltransferase-like isoleucine patch superfamily enzyme